jgi:hypothetical protein
MDGIAHQTSSGIKTATPTVEALSRSVSETTTCAEANGRRIPRNPCRQSELSLRRLDVLRVITAACSYDAPYALPNSPIGDWVRPRTGPSEVHVKAALLCFVSHSQTSALTVTRARLIGSHGTTWSSPLYQRRSQIVQWVKEKSKKLPATLWSSTGRMRPTLAPRKYVLTYANRLARPFGHRRGGRINDDPDPWRIECQSKARDGMDTALQILAGRVPDGTWRCSDPPFALIRSRACRN